MRLHTFWIGTSSTILLAACSADGMGPRVNKLQDAVAQAKVSLRESVVAGQASVTDGKAVKASPPRGRRSRVLGRHPRERHVA